MLKITTKQDTRQNRNHIDGNLGKKIINIEHKMLFIVNFKKSNHD